MEKIAYLDNAATTRPFVELAEIYADCQTNFYNPSAIYDVAVSQHAQIENARDTIKKLLGGENGQIIFTSSATEANNMALSAIKYRANSELIVSMGEHPSVFNKAKIIEQTGVVVKYVTLSQNGDVDVKQLEQMIGNNTALVSIMHVSNETGAINDIKQIVKIVKKVNPKTVVHCDGVQAFGKLEIDLLDLGVDMYTISAHKIHGPKGIGLLWVKNGININPLIFGGGQEHNLRSGTENVFAIKAFEYCAKKVVSDLAKNSAKIADIKCKFNEILTKNNINYKINGKNCTPYILNISVPSIRGEVLVHLLEKHKIYLSVGSACSSKKPDNRVLKQIGRTDNEMRGTIRISFSAYEDFDVQNVCQTICDQIKILARKISGEKDE